MPWNLRHHWKYFTIVHKDASGYVCEPANRLAFAVYPHKPIRGFMDIPAWIPNCKTLERLNSITSPGLCSFVFGSQSTISLSTLCKYKFAQIRSLVIQYQNWHWEKKRLKDWTLAQYSNRGTKQWHLKPTKEWQLWYSNLHTFNEWEISPLTGWSHQAILYNQHS